jgi:multidrug efflux pump subunit AcrB
LARRDTLNRFIELFLRSNLPLILIVLSAALGVAALLVTPREEDPQIVVPMADVYVSFPGHAAREVEELVSTPLERMLYQIDGVEYVYSMSRTDEAVITVRFLVGEDRERSLVKLFKKINENLDVVPPGVTGWVVKPVEIDDVPIVTLTLAGRDGSAAPTEHQLRRVGEELVQRLAAVKDVSRAYVVGGRPRAVLVYLDPDRLAGHGLSPLEIQQAIGVSNTTATAGEFTQNDRVYRVETGRAFASADEVRQLVVGVFGDRPVFLGEVADVVDGPDEPADYVRHGWGPARGVPDRDGAPGTRLDTATPSGNAASSAMVASPAGNAATAPAVTLAVAKKKGTNAVTVADNVLAAAESLGRTVVPDDQELIVTRNAGLSSNDKVNDLLESLLVALVLVVVVLTLGLGWRESLIVSLAIPVVFGLTLAVNLMAGLTINRVTLFALILALGLLVDDPIVDVENIVRHFSLRRKATRSIVLAAVGEIRPPLIAATLAVIVSFLPLYFITGMMGPYMQPMALNVPVTMLMSMLVAFTITPWLSYYLLRGRYAKTAAPTEVHDESYVPQGTLYRSFQWLMRPLLGRPWRAVAFLGVIAVLLGVAVSLAATRRVPLKMLPYGNKDQFQVLLDMPRDTTLEQTDAVVRDFERHLATVPEVTDFTSYVGAASPMDFNGMVRHYYLRRSSHLADIAVNLVDRKSRSAQTHEVTLRIRRDLEKLAAVHGVSLKIVESPPGPPVLSTIVAEVTGTPEQAYEDLVPAAKVVRKRLEMEPGVSDVDDMSEEPLTKLTFVVDKEKAAKSGVSTSDIAQTVRASLGGATAGTLQVPGERQPLRIRIQLPRALRSSRDDLARVGVKGRNGRLVSLGELGHWEESPADQTIYHKNLLPVAYVTAETTDRPPADVVLDVVADRKPEEEPFAGPKQTLSGGWVADAEPKPVADRTFLSNGGGIPWAVSNDVRTQFAGEGEWNMTIDVFRDMGLAFVGAMAAIYIILVAQLKSFLIPLVVMMAIPLTIIGIMPGFWLLNHLGSEAAGGYSTAVYFTATAMIGMIALAGIVTRNSIIIVDFIHQSLRRGTPLDRAIVESCTVRLRPILLTGGTTLLSALPIVIDPIFSGLAWSLMFGLAASTVFTLFVIPAIYWLLYANKKGHGVPTEDESD